MTYLIHAHHLHVDPTANVATQTTIPCVLASKDIWDRHHLADQNVSLVLNARRPGRVSTKNALIRAWALVGSVLDVK